MNIPGSLCEIKLAYQSSNVFKIHSLIFALTCIGNKRLEFNQRVKDDNTNKGQHDCIKREQKK